MKRLLILVALIAVAAGSRAQCLQSSNFTITLKTTGGATVTTVSPNTTYKVHVQGPVPADPDTGPFYNACYSLFNNVRCSPPSSQDTSFPSALAIFTITTSATQIGSGIAFAISPLFANCNCTPNVDWAETKTYDWN